MLRYFADSGALLPAELDSPPIQLFTDGAARWVILKPDKSEGAPKSPFSSIGELCIDRERNASKRVLDAGAGRKMDRSPYEIPWGRAYFPQSF